MYSKNLLVFLIFTILACLCFSISADNYAPAQIRIELTGKDNEYVITYTTGSSTNSSYKVYTEIPSSQVWISETSDNFSAPIKGSSNRFIAGKYQADIHTVIVQTHPGKTYFYKVGDDKHTDGVSRVFSFKAGAPKTWAIFGDYGYINMEQAYKALLDAAQDRVEFQGVMHLGDIAYDLHHQNGQKGDLFMQALEPLTANFPYISIAGNHESTGNFTHFQNRFQGLQHLGHNSGSDTLFWFSWNADHVHYLAFDTEVYFYFKDQGQIERQLNWLEADLIKANLPENRKKYPWIISLGHKCDWQDLVDFTDFRKLLHKYGVDLHLCGHQHNYQRLYPGLQKNVETHHAPDLYVDPQHWTQIVIGSPGCQEKISTGHAPYKNGIASQHLSYGYGLLTVYNATHVEWNWKQTNKPASSANGETLFDQALLAVELLNNDGANEIKDHVMIIQNKHGMRDPY